MSPAHPKGSDAGTLRPDRSGNHLPFCRGRGREARKVQRDVPSPSFQTLENQTPKPIHDAWCPVPSVQVGGPVQFHDEGNSSHGRQRGSNLYPSDTKTAKKESEEWLVGHTTVGAESKCTTCPESARASLSYFALGRVVRVPYGCMFVAMGKGWKNKRSLPSLPACPTWT
jgi:hypothetical protein